MVWDRYLLIVGYLDPYKGWGLCFPRRPAEKLFPRKLGSMLSREQFAKAMDRFRRTAAGLA